MQDKFTEFKQRMQSIVDLESALRVLTWDQRVFMPPGGAEARGRQVALLQRLAHEQLIDPKFGDLLEQLRSYEQGLEYDSYEASMLRLARRDYELAIKVPPDFLEEFAQLSSDSYQVWTEARPQNDFGRIKPYLAQMLKFSRELAEFFEPYDHIADPLIDFYDYGVRVSRLKLLFDQLRPHLVNLLSRISERPQLDRSILQQEFAAADQLRFAQLLAEKIGYDFKRGRHDETPHPFMTHFSTGDVRITTRVSVDNIAESLMSTIHEAGHGMYCQGIDTSFDATVLGDAASMGAHESQSRLWENIVGRSRGFWNWAFPEFQRRFPEQLAAANPEELYAAMNVVQPTPIRVEADEVTYNLHIMIRFDLELQLLEGQLSIDDLPDAWGDRYESDLGIRPPDDRDGVMQDPHWYAGSVGGAFQPYALGNVMAAQLYAAALQAHPEIPAQIERGEFHTLGDWLTENVHQHGRKFTADELVERVTGSSLQIEPYVAYLEAKFGELYQL